MLALPPNDPRNWYRQAIVHVLDCPHANWWFLPWHRGYLLHFEEICRELSADPEFALPFWDWTSTPRVPAALFDDVLSPTHELYEESFQTFRPKFETADWRPVERADTSARSASSSTNVDMLRSMIFGQSSRAIFPRARGPGGDAGKARTARLGDAERSGPSG